jgi:16S rRNA (adenine1518-N6/adenine1519-N6)-dimethyltransferase
MALFSEGIPLKKQHGQNFLRDGAVVDRIINAVTIGPQSSVFEIGCGDGFLTRAIVGTKAARIWVFEIDPQWASYVEKNVLDARLKIFNQDILTIDVSLLEPYKPWILLANLPYHITFPILHMLKEHAHMLQEGVIMVQEEVAQKLVKTHGRGYGFISLFFQYYFEWKLLEKVPPTAFLPPPKIFSRLLHFKPRKSVDPIPDEAEFWRFVKVAFKQPRRTLKNNFLQTHISVEKIPQEILLLRAQQMDMNALLNLWRLIRS